MTERGMIFNAEMVRAILDGRKTQTRRIIKLSHERGMLNPVVRGRNGEISSITCRLAPTLCPLGQPGDHIWVRETFGDCGERLVYRADTDDGAKCKVKRWTPSIHMPRWASRILLEITDVRVEQLQAITLGDICKEFGCGLYDFRPATYGFQAWEVLWKSIYGDDSWQANPWVWVIEFKRIEGDGHETD
ncbi:hypothetical protein [Escherichia coli]|uniref:hypothetical protein n=1 Tax=Escherichia coli TaxID=562 RepID=UPI000B3DBD1A|nr:hypothetical protein [Escherichia coli]EFE4924921.1 hypothetical protein [Escherichia coli]EKA3902570.1 hypothetical protein [Escherichia coli]MBM0448379.1 hypothetical protein [Escherichia coli]MDO2508166.1 hypothetical protein [Escherichia coli]MDO2512584.1 hypothetical protein [Escherichia coli]